MQDQPHERQCTCFNKISDLIFLKPQSAKVFLSVWEGFLLQHSNSFYIKNFAGSPHKLHQTCWLQHI